VIMKSSVLNIQSYDSYKYVCITHPVKNVVLLESAVTIGSDPLATHCNFVIYTLGGFCTSFTYLALACR
jgi:hypothetical protein